jgi:DNA-binding transcriptional ArsR family regulator
MQSDARGRRSAAHETVDRRKPAAHVTLDRTLAALADPTRREVIDLLRRKPRRASDIARALSMSKPAMSRHLRLLRKTGLVTKDEPLHDARVRVYRLEREPFAELRGWLEEVEAFWTGQLAAFKAHAEKRGRGA